MDHEHEVVVHYTNATLRRAARRFLTRLLLRDIIIWVTVGFLGLGACWQFGYDWPEAAFLGGGPVIVIAVGVFVGLANVRGAGAKFKGVVDRTVRWRFHDEMFETTSDLESVELPWESVVEVWRFSEVWLLFFGSRHWGYSALPTSSLSPELQEHILSRVKAHGGKIA